MKTAAAAQAAHVPMPVKSASQSRKPQSKSDPAVRALLSAPESVDFDRLTQELKQSASEQKAHPQPARKREEMQNAAVLQPLEQNDQSSQEKNVRQMGHIAHSQGDVKEKFDAWRFQRDFAVLVRQQKPPKDAAQVKAYAKDPPVKEFPAKLSGDMVQQQREIVKPLQEQTTRTPQPDPFRKAVAIPAPVYSPRPAPPESKLAIPARRSDGQSQAQVHRDRMDSAMQASRLTDDQLAQSREPRFLSALQAKQQAQQRLDETPAAFEARESEILERAETSAGDSLSAGLQRMNALNRRTSGEVSSSQGKAASQTIERKRAIKGTIVGIGSRTATDVQKILADMAGQVKGHFAAALERQTKVFNDDLRKAIDDYYGSTRIDDYIWGPDDVEVLDNGETRPISWRQRLGREKRPEKTINPDVYRIFLLRKYAFIGRMQVELEKVAGFIQTGLTEASNRIDTGEQDVTRFVATLSGDERTYAEGLERDVGMKFEGLRHNIDETRDDLLRELASQYQETVDQLEKTAWEINDELKKSFIDRAVDFIETVGSTIVQLAELLVSILTRVAHLVGDIIQHPIRFFETLVAGIGRGMGQFIDGFGTYLQEAFWTWLSGSTAVKNIRLSASSGIEGLFDMVVPVLNLGPPQLREIATDVFGKPVMDQIDRVLAIGEKAVEPLQLLLTKGPIAVWDQMREMLGDLVQSTFDRIKESVFFAFIRKALKWIAGFFVPGGGFVKIVQAIFRAFQFVAENLQRIRELFDSVFDSMQDALDGRTEGVAGKVLAGLKTGIVLALDFLAKQLGLAQIIDDVHKVLDSLRRPIVRAITWLLTKIKPFVTRLVDAAVSVGKGAVKLGKDAIERVYNWWTARKEFTSEEGEPHTLFFEGSEHSARLMIRSEPQTYSGFLKEVTVPESKRAKAARREAIGIAAELDQAVKDAAARRGAAAWDGTGLRKDPSQEINRLLDRLAAATARFIPNGPAGEKESSRLVFGPLVHGFGSSVRVAQLTKKIKGGSEPSDSVTGIDWRALSQRMDGNGSYYVRGHLLNHNIGGPGDDWANLTPLTQRANNRGSDSMYNGFEKKVVERIRNGARFKFVVTASFTGSHPLAGRVAKLAESEQPDDRAIAQIIRAEQHIPRSVLCEAQELSTDEENPDSIKHLVKNDIETDSVDDYKLTGEPVRPFYINDYLPDKLRRNETAKDVASELMHLDEMTPEILEKLIENKPPGGYRTGEQLKDAGFKKWERAIETKRLRVRIYRRDS